MENKCKEIQVITIYVIIHVISNSYKGNIIHFELAIVPNHLLTDQVATHTGESLLRNNSDKGNIIHFELAIVPNHLLTNQVTNHTGESL